MNKQPSYRGVEWSRVYGRVGYTSNPIRGCKHECRWRMPDGAVAICYAEATAKRMPMHYQGGFGNITFHPEELEEWKKLSAPAGIFLDSMADLFGAGVKDEWIRAVLATVRACPQHVFLGLTKNAGKLNSFTPFPDNFWCGVSAPPSFMFGKELSEDQKLTWFDNSLKHLVQTDAKIKWVSLEPLSMDLSSVLTNYRGSLDWAVIGAMSDGHRKHQPDKDVLKRTIEALGDCPLFFKGNLDRALAEEVAGRWYQEFPPMVGQIVQWEMRMV